MIKYFLKKKLGSTIKTDFPAITCTSIKNSIKITNKLYMIYKKRPIPENENKYKRYKHILNKATKVAEQDYYEDIFRQNKDNLSKSWKTLKDILNKKKGIHNIRSIQSQWKAIDKENGHS